MRWADARLGPGRVDGAYAWRWFLVAGVPLAFGSDFPVEIVVCPIVREPDGLAMSSRNVYLNPAERRAATALWRALLAAQAAYNAGQRQAETLRQVVVEQVEAEPLARLQYASCADPETLAELHGPVSGGALLSLAVYFGKTRLIDNLILGGA